MPRMRARYAGAIMLALLTGASMPTDKDQTIRASVVIYLLHRKKHRNDRIVRLSLQRIVRTSHAGVTRSEWLKDPALYKICIAQAFAIRLPGGTQDMNATTIKTIVLAAALAAGGCAGTASQRGVLATDEEQGRTITRDPDARFRHHRQEAALRAVIQTLQDFGFIIDRADAVLGAVERDRARRLSPAHDRDGPAPRRHPG